MFKYLAKFIYLSILIATFANFSANAAKLSSPDYYDEEKESFNELESLKCLPSGFPCTPVPATTTGMPEEELTTTSSVTLPEDVTTMESITTTTDTSTTASFPNKNYRNFPASCCTKCLYEPGWIDAVCA